eukprot:gene7917-8772_t
MMFGDDKFDFYGKAKKEYLPTYRLQPADNKRFSVAKVKQIMEAVLEERLLSELYEPIKCRRFITEIVDDVKARVKSLDFSRYKIVVVANIGSVHGQCVNVASRCVWADKTDNFASVSFHNNSLFAVATVFAIYHE